MSDDERLLAIPESHAGLRVDVALQQLLPEFSRSKLQEWIKDEFVFVNQSPVSSKHKVYAGDEIKIPTRTPSAPYFSIKSIGSGELPNDLDILRPSLSRTIPV